MPSQSSRRARTGDRGPPSAVRAPIYTVGRIGDNRKLLANGSLLCENVPIARTGVQMYREGEIPLEAPKRPGAAKVIYVTRDRATLFAPESLGSIVGAAITLDHPPVDVDPTNWNMLAKGFVMDAWQGEDGDAADLMFADLVVTDKGLIHKINHEGLREVSLGYSAHYEQTGDGEGRQHGIVSNHVALVERGRCGPRCAIGDRQPGEMNMAKAGTGGSRPRVRLNDTVAAMREHLDALAGDGEDGEDEDGVHVHVHMGSEGGSTHTARTTDGDDGGGDDDPPRNRTIDAATEERFGNIEEGMLELRDAQTSQNSLLAAIAAKVGVEPPKSNTADGDSTALQTSYMQFAAHAEILVPGYKATTFDSALPRAKTVDAMCSGRRAVLTLLGATADGATLLKNVTSDEGFDVAAAPCDMVATVFKSAATVKAASNNRSTTGDRLSVPIGTVGQSVVGGGGMKMPTADEINAANAEYWAKQNRSS